MLVFTGDVCDQVYLLNFNGFAHSHDLFFFSFTSCGVLCAALSLEVIGVLVLSFFKLGGSGGSFSGFKKNWRGQV